MKNSLMPSEQGQIAELALLENQQNGSPKTLIEIADGLGYPRHRIYDAVARLRKQGKFPKSTITRNRKKVRKIVFVPAKNAVPPVATDDSNKATDSEIELKAKVMAQSQIIKYLEQQLGLKSS